jgi:hypothetical protein
MEFIGELLKWLFFGACIVGGTGSILLMIIAVTSGTTEKLFKEDFEKAAQKTVDKLFGGAADVQHWKVIADERAKQVSAMERNIELKEESIGVITRQRDLLEKSIEVMWEGIEGGFDAEAIKDQVEYVTGKCASVSE